MSTLNVIRLHVLFCVCFPAKMSTLSVICLHVLLCVCFPAKTFQHFHAEKTRNIRNVLGFDQTLIRYVDFT